MAYPKTKKIMNEIVADLTQAHMVVHQHHWYMLGRGFLKLHPYLDDVMDELAEQQDGVAERLIEINGSPISTYEEVLEETNVPDQVGSWDLSMEERFQHQLLPSITSPRPNIFFREFLTNSFD